MLDAELLNKSEGEHPRGKCTTENVAKFGVQTTDTHIFELKVRR